MNKPRLAMTKPDALIMHPGPLNRGVEIDSDIADSGRSLISEQVTNGLAVRMAALFLVFPRSVEKPNSYQLFHR